MVSWYSLPSEETNHKIMTLHRQSGKFRVAIWSFVHVFEIDGDLEGFVIWIEFGGEGGNLLHNDVNLKGILILISLGKECCLVYNFVFNMSPSRTFL